VRRFVFRPHWRPFLLLTGAVAVLSANVSAHGQPSARLDVTSQPIQSVSIQGPTCGGTTNYSCIKPVLISTELTAPGRVKSAGGPYYDFSSWSGCDYVSGRACGAVVAVGDQQSVAVEYEVPLTTVAWQVTGVAWTGETINVPLSVECSPDPYYCLSDGVYAPFTATTYFSLGFINDTTPTARITAPAQHDGMDFLGWTEGCDSVAGRTCVFSAQAPVCECVHIFEAAVAYG